MVRDIVSEEQIGKLKAIGWQIVPIEPDLNMKKASVKALGEYDEEALPFDIAGWFKVWPDMLKAAPAP